jgi:hypothetical protein
MKRRVISFVLAIGLSVFVGSCAAGLAALMSGREQVSELLISPDSPLAKEAWAAALKLASVAEPWIGPKSITRVDAVHMIGPEQRNLGLYFSYLSADSFGNSEVHEQIVIFVRLDEPRILLRNVLIHEDLHAIYNRLSMKSPLFGLENADDEGWVCGHGGCPENPLTMPIRVP